MNYKEYVAQVAKDLRTRYGLNVQVQDINKLQGESYHGLAIATGKPGLSACLNLEVFYEALGRMGDYDEILQDVYAASKNAIEKTPAIEVERLTGYEGIRKLLTVQLVPRTGNEAMLAAVPHHDVLDLALVYRIEFPEVSREGEKATTLLANAHLERFGITESQLYEDAICNAAERHPATIRSLFETLGAMMGAEAVEQEMGGSDSIYIATCEGGVWGAGVIAYPGFLDKAAEKMGGNYYILPSSVHEMLLLSDTTTHMGYQALERMVQEINRSEVRPQDRLSDHVYHYDAQQKALELASDYEVRRAEHGMMSRKERPSLLVELNGKKAITAAAVTAKAAETVEKTVPEKSHGGRSR